MDIIKNKQSRICFPCNGQKACRMDPNCGLTHVFGQCRHTLDPRYAAPFKKKSQK